MTDSESVQWQPLSALAKVARDVDEQFTNTREQYEQLLRARDQPHLLDDAVVARVMRLVTDELEFLPVYREQLACWYQSQPTPGQFIELDRMTHQLDRWRELLQRQLALAQELNVGTIDKVLAKSDHELAAALLCGDMKFPPANDTNEALHSQGTVLGRSWMSAPWLVAKRRMGDGTHIGAASKRNDLVAIEISRVAP